jgi:hypothetical protein
MKCTREEQLDLIEAALRLLLNPPKRAAVGHPTRLGGPRGWRKKGSDDWRGAAVESARFCFGAAILEALRDELKGGDKALAGNTGFRRYLKTGRGDHFAIDPARVAADTRFEGFHVLRTWPQAGCSKASATTASSIAIGVRFFRRTRLRWRR